MDPSIARQRIPRQGLSRSPIPRELVWAILPAVGAGLAALASGRLGAVLALVVGLAVPLLVLVMSRWVASHVALLAVVPAMWLPLFTTTSSRFVIGGQVVGGYDVAPARMLIVGAAGLWLIAVLVLGWRRPGIFTVARSRSWLLWCGLPVLVVGLGFRYQVHATAASPGEGSALVSREVVEAGGRVGSDLVVSEGFGQQILRPWLSSRLLGRSLRGLRLYQVVAESLDRAVLTMAGIALLPPAWAALFGLAVAIGMPPPSPAGLDLVAHVALLLAGIAMTSHASRLSASAGAAGGAALWWQLPSGLSVVVAAAAVLALARARSALVFSLSAAAVVTLVAARIGFAALGSATPPAAVGSLGAAAAVGLVWGIMRFSSSGQFGAGAIPFLWVVTLLGTCLSSGDAAPSLLLLFALVASAPSVVRGLAVALLACLATLPARGGAAAALPRALSELAARSLVSLDDRSRLVVSNTVSESRIGVLLPLVQARQIGPLLTNLNFLSPEIRLLDLSDTPILYFLADRKPPTAYTRLRRAESLAAQRDLAGQIRDHPPELVVTFPGGSEPLIELAGGHLLAAEVLRLYRPSVDVGGFLLLTRQGRGAADLVEPVVRLGMRPRALALALADSEKPIEIPWTPQEPNGARLSADDAWATLTAIVLEIASPRGGSATLNWYVSGAHGGVARVDFALVKSADPVSYLVPVAGLPAWAWAEAVSGVAIALDGGELRRVFGRDDALDRAR